MTTTSDPRAKTGSGGALTDWTPEDNAFWDATGKRIANRNLWISIPCLLVAFAVWLSWSIVTVQMRNLGFPFTDGELFTLQSIAGLTGATLRIPNSFMIAIGGGRNVIAVTTGLLLIPAVGLGIALQDPTTPVTVFYVLAALSGIGGGNFASSMSSISFFFPKRVQGVALGLNAGLGNVGVSVMQVLLPWVMTFSLLGIGGAALTLPAAVGDSPEGTKVWIQNSGLVWVPILVLLTIAAAWGMTNLPIFKIGRSSLVVIKVLGLELIGLAGAAAGLLLLLWLGWSMWLVLPITIVLTVLMMKLLRGELATNLQRQFGIFRAKHNWVMTWLYTMTFGSFIGFSMAFPLLIKVVFGTLADGKTPNPDAPNPFAYAWLGPLVGSLIRPVGGWLSDKLSGARVTQWTTVVMIGATLGVAYYIRLANGSDVPQDYFAPFLGLFLLLFVTTGVGNGSTFRMVPIIFPPEKAGPVLGWISAVAAYGAFLIPRVFKGQVEAGTPEFALYGFAVYYTSCLVVNWWFYARRNAECPC